MSVKHELEIESDFAKSYVMNCQDMDEEYKKDLVNLIDTATLATNGISQEEKIQKITESIAKLAVSQVGMIKSIKTIIINTLNEHNDKINEKIVEAIEKANSQKCEQCKAMKHATDVEEEKKKQDIINDFIKKSGMQIKTTSPSVTTTNTINEGKKNIYDTIKEMVVKPWIWIFGSILVFSPTGFDIIKLLVDTFVKK